MKLELSIELAAPRETVWRAFSNIDNLQRWQPGLIAYEPVSGAPGEVGGVSRLLYREGDREIEMAETITVRRPPEEFAATYATDHGTTEMSHRFSAIAPDRTRWDVVSQMQLKGMARLMAPVLRGVIENRVRGDCERFQALLAAGELEM